MASRLHHFPFIFTLFLFFILTVLIFLPYWKVIFLSMVMAIIFWPLFLKINKIILWRWAASLVTVILISIIILIPFSILGTLVFKEAIQLYSTITNGKNLLFLNSFFLSFQKQLKILSPYWLEEENIQVYLKSALEWVIKNLGAIFSKFVRGTLAFVFSLFILFYLFKDKDKFKVFISAILPLEDEHRELIFQRVKSSVRSVVGGSLVVAFVQGIISGIGFSIFGLPNPALWGGVAALSALIPTVGTSLVIGPAIVFLYFFDSPFSALGLLIWGVIAVGLIDNLLGPFLMKKGTNIHPLLVFFSVLGGVSLFGPIGLMVGPVGVSIFFSLLDAYAKIIKNY